MNNNNEDMLISPENIQNTITPSNNEPVSNVESLDVQANNVVDQNVNNSVINTVNSAANEQVQFNNVEPIRDNANIVNNQNAEQKITDINPGNVQSTVNTPVNNYTENNAVSNQNTTNINPEPTYNPNEQNVDFDNNGVNYYQEGVSNINASKSKPVYMNGWIGAIILLALAIIHYFIIAPFIEKFLIEQSVYEAFSGISKLISSGSIGMHDTKIYLYTFAFLTYTAVSLELMIYFVINLVKQGDLICDFRKHITSMVVITAIISIFVIILYVKTDIDLFTPMIRVITIDENQLKLVLSEFMI